MEVQSALFENNVFLMGQHMLQYAMTGRHPQPMPARDNPWAVYDVFTVKDGEQIFLAAVSDAQWQTFCDALGFADLKADPRWPPTTIASQLRPQLLATLRERLALAQRRRAVATICEARRPALRADPQARGPATTTRTCWPPAAWPTCVLPDGDKAGQTVKTTLFPITLDGERLRVRLQPPRAAANTPKNCCVGLGYADAEIDDLREPGRG